MPGKSTKPAKMYAVVLADGTSEEFKTKRQSIARGEYSGQDFTVLSPRGYEVHVHKVEPVEQSASIEVGDVIQSDRRGAGEITVARLRVGKTWMTVYDAKDVQHARIRR